MNETNRTSQSTPQHNEIMPSLEAKTAEHVKDLEGMRFIVQRSDGHFELMIATGLMETVVHRSFDAHNHPIDNDYLVQMRGEEPTGTDEQGRPLYPGKWVPESLLETKIQEEYEQYLTQRGTERYEQDRLHLGHVAWEALHRIR